MNSVKFDTSGVYLAAGSSDIRIYQVKVWTELKKLTEHKDKVTDIGFGRDALYLASTSLDRHLRIFTSKN